MLMVRALAVLLLLAGLVAGCGGDAPAPATVAPAVGGAAPLLGSAVALSPGAADVARPVLASSNLVVGANRFVFGLLDSQTGQPIPDVPQTQLQFFKVHDDGTATKTGDAAVVYQNENLPAGLFVAQTTFDAAGSWGALLTVQRPGRTAYDVRLNFTVRADSPIPGVGAFAPRSRNLTLRDVRDVAEIDSAQPHDTMHNLTIAEAVKSGKPTLVLFGTPGFCESRMCGPDLAVAQALQSKYAAQANFIHIETPSHTHLQPVNPEHYTTGGHAGVARPQIATMQEWGLQTEPWIFLVDRTGVVVAEFEGGLTLQEVEPAFVPLLR